MPPKASAFFFPTGATTGPRQRRGSLMDARQKTLVVLAVFVILFVCFAIALFLQLWSILTMTTVGTVGTLIGCVSFVPVLLLGNAIALIVGFRKEIEGTQPLVFIAVLVANAILIVTGVVAIIQTVNSLPGISSMFVPETIDWSDWLMELAIFAGPQALAMAVAVFGLIRLKRRARQADEPPEAGETGES
jgi:hypothetical protein